MRRVTKTKLPPDACIGECLGKGANNCVVEVEWRGSKKALRMPRRKSETLRVGAAEAEAAAASIVAELGAAPHIHAMWHAKHGTHRFPSGLYMITDVYERSLDRAMVSPGLHRVYSRHAASIREKMISHLTKMAKRKVFCFDLKPQNVMINGLGPDDDDSDEDDGSDDDVDAAGGRGGGAQDSQSREHSGGDTGDIDVRFIDFGSEFCELDFSIPGRGRHAPTIDMVRERIRAKEPEIPLKVVEQRVEHVLFAAMLVVLSACTTFQLYEDRHEHRMSRSMRARVNPLASPCAHLLEGMQGKNLSLLRSVLRSDKVRDVLGHYHGRRNAGTRRTLRFAQGAEC